MEHAVGDKLFSGSIPQLYEEYLVPLIFESYAADLAHRLAAMNIASVLELAAGTGVATRAIAAALPSSMTIVATDLNQPMLDHAMRLKTRRPVEWQQADALDLPFADRTFDAVVCQFGAMFFTDKPRAFAEARRVLAPGGTLIFSVWDRIEDNEFADVVTSALAAVFPDDPPRFLARTPHGYFDVDEIRRDVANGGFRHPPHITTIAARSRAARSDIPALAYCHGTPLRNEIEARSPDGLADATAAATAAITRRFGEGPVDGKIQAHVVTVRA